ncbi:hypothetical protein HYT25_01010 [Candidatus Pacearchaeota archaeon]|nr:hypothetical protein [Candidatus Pacearchaeota archaeon]
MAKKRQRTKTKRLERKNVTVCININIPFENIKGLEADLRFLAGQKFESLEHPDESSCRRIIDVRGNITNSNSRYNHPITYSVSDYFFIRNFHDDPLEETNLLRGTRGYSFGLDYSRVGPQERRVNLGTKKYTQEQLATMRKKK